MQNEFEDYLKRSGEIGYIQSINHSVVYLSGLPSVRPQEIVVAEKGQKGIVQSLQEDRVEVLMLSTEGLANNLAFTRTGKSLMIEVSEGILGRVVDPLGHALDGKGPLSGEKKLYPIDQKAPPISARARINQHFETGVQVVDLLIPLGYGQRELVIGDKKTGKSIFLLQTMATQVKRGLVCVYVSIGKRQSDVKAVEEYLVNKKIASNVVLLVANSAASASLIYLAPLSGMAIAEYFRDIGRDTLIIFDDLSNHAKFYREISLLEKRAPGRSSYPGDIFNLHASLLERAGNVRMGNRAVSITALPVAESFEGDITGYIQTNLMSITDGHIFFDIDQFRNGVRPAISHALSVSRVGNQTRSQLEKDLAQSIRDALGRYEKDKEIARFGVDLPQTTKDEIDLGEKVQLLLTQDTDTLVSKELSLILFALLFGGFWKEKNESMMKVDLIKLTRQFELGYMKDLVKKIASITSVEDLSTQVKEFYSSVERVLYE